MFLKTAGDQKDADRSIVTVRWRSHPGSSGCRSSFLGTDDASSLRPSSSTYATPVIRMFEHLTFIGFDMTLSWTDFYVFLFLNFIFYLTVVFTKF